MLYALGVLSDCSNNSNEGSKIQNVRIVPDADKDYIDPRLETVVDNESKMYYLRMITGLMSIASATLLITQSYGMKQIGMYNTSVNDTIYITNLRLQQNYFKTKLAGTEDDYGFHKKDIVNTSGGKNTGKKITPPYLKDIPTIEDKNSNCLLNHHLRLNYVKYNRDGYSSLSKDKEKKINMIVDNYASKHKLALQDTINAGRKYYFSQRLEDQVYSKKYVSLQKLVKEMNYQYDSCEMWFKVGLVMSLVTLLLLVYYFIFKNQQIELCDSVIKDHGTAYFKNKVPSVYRSIYITDVAL
jgi:hypothetical protein